MEMPFYGNYYPNYANLRRVPVHQDKKFSSRKVTSIPVRFVDSERTRSSAALKIQRVMKGFLVRKNVKKILKIKSEVEEIERKLSQREMIELIKNNPKEKLAVQESVMALLFRLDSVIGGDVRVCRRKVTRKVISLQELIDSIGCEEEKVQQNKIEEIEADDADKVLCRVQDPDESHSKNHDFDQTSHEYQDTDGSNLDYSEEPLETRARHENISVSMHRDEGKGGMEDKAGIRCIRIDAFESDCSMEATETEMNHEELPKSGIKSRDESKETTYNSVAFINQDVDGFHCYNTIETPESKGDCENKPESETELQNETIDQNTENSETIAVSVNESVNPPAIEERSNKKTMNVLDQLPSTRSGEIQNFEHSQIETKKSCLSVGQETIQENDKAAGETTMKENAILHGLILQLLEQSKLQSDVINVLTQRVEQLETAFLRCESMKKKKKNRRQPCCKKI